MLITGGSRYAHVHIDSSDLVLLPTHSRVSLGSARIYDAWNRGLGAVIGEKFAAEGANIAINYASNKDAADKLAERLQSEFKIKTAVIQGVSLVDIVYPGRNGAKTCKGRWKPGRLCEMCAGDHQGSRRD